MSDLSRALVDAAAEAVHARLCGCGQSAADADEHIETGRVAVAAVLETLAATAPYDEDGGFELWHPPALRGLAAEVKEERP